ncbi:MAG: carbohydrate ABC transporter permease [Clostridia bacterium]|nr:carbohydrate ABC transporter permease [Clostridia bacterium]MBQ7108335.1 carbohydrate ABC transporter permease [Clostridia bacterium]MBQ9919861.1 carbohydrate ABC transporter permease [Clostridia bacterium]
MTTEKKLKRTVPALNKYKLKSVGANIVVSIFRYVLLIAISYIILYPLFAMIGYSFMSKADMLDTSVTWIAKRGTFENYKVAWEALEYPTSLLNTITIHLVSAVLEIFSCAVAAYGFARFKFKCRGLLFGIVLFTAIVPVQILVIPLFLNYQYFGFGYIVNLLNMIPGVEIPYISLTDTPFTFWLPSLFGAGLRSGLFIFIYRQFFIGLPKELEEASWIDGCNPLMTFFRVVIPSSGVVFLTVSIFSIIWHWNEYYQSVIFFNETLPLSVVLSGVRSLKLENMGYREQFAAPGVSASCLLFMAPILIMYLFLQKKFIQSIDRVGIVG